MFIYLFFFFSFFFFTHFLFLTTSCSYRVKCNEENFCSLQVSVTTSLHLDDGSNDGSLIVDVESPAPATPGMMF